MFLRRRLSDAPVSRGQALVEVALILPILVLLLVMALDFGRVFFGWVGLQNGARIAADFAASNAESWPNDQDLYRNLVINDMQGINCKPPVDPNGNGLWDAAEVPDPTFEDGPDLNADTTDDGDYARVTLTCNFDVMTPLASAIVGNPVVIGAEAYFPINQILVPAIPTPEPTPPGPCPAPTALFALEETPPKGPGNNPTDGRGGSPLTIVFTDTSTDDSSCPITTWSWDFGSTASLTAVPSTFDGESPPPVTFTHPTGSGPHVNFLVELTLETADGLTDTFTKSIRVDP